MIWALTPNKEIKAFCWFYTMERNWQFPQWNSVDIQWVEIFLTVFQIGVVVLLSVRFRFRFGVQSSYPLNKPSKGQTLDLVLTKKHVCP